MTKDEIVRAVRAERRRTLSLLSRLLPEEFDLPALPGWRIREILAHLVTTDRASVTGTILPVVFVSMDKLEAWNERQVRRWAGRPPAHLLVALDRWGRRFARLAAAIPSAVYRTPMPTLWGRGPAGMLVFGRAYDEWVHRQDIRRALGRPDEQVDLAPIGEFLLRAVGMHTLPRLEGEGGRVVISLEGAPLLPWTYDLSTGVAAPGGTEAPAARIEAAAPEFIMAAAGRNGFRDLEARGELRIEGDAELARRFLSRLRIV